MKDRLIERWRAARRDPTLVVLEGLHALKHAVRFGAEIDEIRLDACSSSEHLARQLAPDLLPLLRHGTPVSAETFRGLTPQPVRTGVVALARRPPFALAKVPYAPIVLLDQPADYGNLGAVIRTSAAAGAAAVLCRGRLDPWRPAAVRGSAGLHFALAVGRIDLEALAALASAERPLVAIDPAGAPLKRKSLPHDAVFAFGSERDGLSTEVRGRARRHVAIPMRQGVSSLNLAASVAIVLYTMTEPLEGPRPG